MATSPTPNAAHVINYDADGYDYRRFWQGKEYEHWAEARVIRRTLRGAGAIDWLVDLGGGFGRNIPLYQPFARHVVLVDFSWTNLQNAAAQLLPKGPSDRLFLIRGNIYHLPFRDSSIEVGCTVRVLHHLAATDAALAEMGRVLSQHWLLDVPIKHHLLARAKAMARGRARALRDWSANDIGTPDEPFYNYHLDAIRTVVQQQGWSDKLVASVDNFRRWERVVPGAVRPVVRPVVYGAERVAQRAGRGWWGPAQYLWLSRTDRPLAAAPETQVPAPWTELAARLQCPQCGGALAWTSDAATCQQCHQAFQRTGAIWDFVVD